VLLILILHEISTANFSVLLSYGHFISQCTSVNQAAECKSIFEQVTRGNRNGLHQKIYK